MKVHHFDLIPESVDPSFTDLSMDEDDPENSEESDEEWTEETEKQFKEWRKSHSCSMCDNHGWKHVTELVEHFHKTKDQEVTPKQTEEVEEDEKEKEFLEWRKTHSCRECDKIGWLDITKLWEHFHRTKGNEVTPKHIEEVENDGKERKPCPCAVCSPKRKDKKIHSCTECGHIFPYRLVVFVYLFTLFTCLLYM